MPATRLRTHRVAKPWGRQKLWPGFADAADGELIGEIWFQTEGDEVPELLVKYLFTSEKLSIQVHPDDTRARAAGYPRGKDEVWVILDAEPEATIALGLKAPTTRDHLRQSALDGSIEQLVDWKPVKAGEVIYSAAGTVHAIGAGLTLIEVQQNVDLTYRLYDYGRPRELHLDAGIAVSDPVPFTPSQVTRDAGDGRTILTEGPKFVLERWQDGTHSLALGAIPALLIPVVGGGTVDGQRWTAGECWSVTGDTRVVLDAGADVLFAYPGGDVVPA